MKKFLVLFFLLLTLYSYDGKIIGEYKIKNYPFNNLDQKYMIATMVDDKDNPLSNITFSSDCLWICEPIYKGGKK